MILPSNSDLPFGMAVAAITTELDNIEVVLVKEPIDNNWAVGVYPNEVEDYEKVLVRKLASIINENIKEGLIKKPDAKLYIYVFAQIVKDGDLMIASSKCEIK